MTKRIRQVFEQLKAQKTRPTVNSIVVQSLFSPGGTLTGHEQRIKQFLKIKSNG
jgi:hypothetical protein